jgi:PEGA domain-containing protein
MNSSLKLFRRLLIACLASTIVFGSVSMIGAVFAVLPRAEAATNTIQQKVTVPPCMRRVTVTSKPCGATIYVDSIQVGRTPLSFPMPPGRYTLILLAPGHQQYSRRILVPDAPLEIEANLVPSS